MHEFCEIGTEISTLKAKECESVLEVYPAVVQHWHVLGKNGCIMNDINIDRIHAISKSCGYFEFD